VPPQDRVGRHNRGQGHEQSATESLAPAGEAPALGVGQSKSSSPQLLLQDPILLDEVVDDLGLVPVDPAREGGEEQLETEAVERYVPIVEVP
jgi:hypothetical protein